MAANTPRTSNNRGTDEPLKFIDTWQPRKREYPRHKIAIIALLVGIALALVFKPGSILSIIGIVIVVLDAIWWFKSPQLIKSDIKFWRHISLDADTADEAGKTREEAFIKALIKSGFIDQKTRAYSEDIWVKAIDVDVEDPWTFLLRDRQVGRQKLDEVQKYLDKTFTFISNGRKDAEMVIVESTKTSGHMFKVFVYFTFNTASFEDGWDINTAMNRKPAKEAQEEETIEGYEQFDQGFSYPDDFKES